jgi:ATP-binding cassette subfamily B protein
MKNKKVSQEATFQPGFGKGHGMMGVGDKPKNIGVTLRRLWKYMAVYRIQFYWLIALVILASGAVIIGPYLIGIAIDRYIIPADFIGLAWILGIMLLIYLSRSLFYWLQNVLMIDIAQDTVLALRKDIFHTLQTLPIRYFDTHSKGDTMSRVTNDIENISNTLNSAVTQFISSLLSVVGTVIMMLVLSPLLTAFALIILPIMLIATKFIASKTKTYFLQQQQHLGKLNGIIEETITGQKVVTVFNHEEAVISEVSVENQRLRKVGIKAQIFAGIIPPFMGVLNNVSFAIVAGVGGWMVLSQMITVGVIASFVNYTRQFTRPLAEMANQFTMIQSAVAGAERVFQVLDEAPEPLDDKNAHIFDTVKGDVEFSDVTFGYNPFEPVLKHITFSAKPGQSIALVGPTGAGKTTIVNLLTRFYDIQEGSIHIDGHNLQAIQRESLRNSLAIVLQDTHLFSESVLENIRYGRLNATDDEVKAAAKMANAHHFINHLPDGYHTILSEDGGNISEGQRQLLSIARAILADPPILILDEATSSVDTRTEMHIQEALLKLMKGRTSFVIAHRLSTIRKSDLILVIDHGEIIERGTHKELMVKKGFYYQLHQKAYQKQI